MSFVAQLEADFKNFLAKVKDHFGAVEHPIVAEGEAIASRLKTAAQAVEGQAQADGEHVVHDAEAAAKPVIAEAEADATRLEAAVVHDAEKAVTDPAPPTAS